MTNDQPCHRPSYHRSGYDPQPFCLMHSRDPQKDNQAFQAEIEDILRKAESAEGVADFRGFVFGEARYLGRVFKPSCIFSGAMFTQEADFRGATFARDAHFRGAKFTQIANFRGVTFAQFAHFSEATFAQVAQFRVSTFALDANFSRAMFTRDAHFGKATFTGDAHFDEAPFSQEAKFSGATFMGDAYFGQATFAEDADFIEARFMRDAHFAKVTFAQRAIFRQTAIEQDADFSEVIFTEDAIFSEAKLNQVADFRDAEFRDVSIFIKTRFRGDPGVVGSPEISGIRSAALTKDDARFPGPVFTRTTFERPQDVEFYQTYLGQALFHGCDVSKFLFSNVTWRRRRRGVGQLMIFEEAVEVGAGNSDATRKKQSDYRWEVTEALRPGQGDPNERNYSLIAEIYQQLHKNYDERRDYVAAGDFYFGEMEMKRLAGPQRVRALRWWHQNLGLVAFYKYASAYGESYVRPVVALLIVLGIFTLLFPWAGLELRDKPANSVTAVAAQPTQPPAATTELSYRHFADFVRAYPGEKWVAPAAFFGNSLMTSLNMFPFQRQLKYEPSYPWGETLARLGLLLTSTLIGLFLLAVRRQFKR
jgi:uncharacterized protein YjbI with pentapeptide repeats